MCGAYYVDDETLEEMRRVASEVYEQLNGKPLRAEIRPSALAPVLIGGNSGIRLAEQQWGYPGFQNKGIVFNARSESVLEKRMFRNGIYNTRAVIPVKHFYEWNKRKEKNTFKRADGRVLYLAGFYDSFDGINKFIILTTAANESMVGTHDRMPLVLENNQIRDWIFNNDKTEELLKQVPILLSRTSSVEQISFNI